MSPVTKIPQCWSLHVLHRPFTAVAPQPYRLQKFSQMSWPNSSHFECTELSSPWQQWMHSMALQLADSCCLPLRPLSPLPLLASPIFSPLSGPFFSPLFSLPSVHLFAEQQHPNPIFSWRSTLLTDPKQLARTALSLKTIFLFTPPASKEFNIFTLLWQLSTSF